VTQRGIGTDLHATAMSRWVFAMNSTDAAARGTIPAYPLERQPRYAAGSRLALLFDQEPMPTARKSNPTHRAVRTPGVACVEHEDPRMTRPCVTDRVPRRKPRKDKSEQPRLELPLHEPPQHEQARPQRPDDEPKRGVAVVDFYV
jgi:hypothetical protein